MGVIPCSFSGVKSAFSSLQHKLCRSDLCFIIIVSNVNILSERRGHIFMEFKSFLPQLFAIEYIFCIINYGGFYLIPSSLPSKPQ